MIAWTLAGSLAVGIAVDSGDENPHTLELEALRREVQAFRERPDDWTVQHAEEVRCVVSRVLADADTRRALAGGVGHDGGFFIASGDGSFRLELSGYLQVRGLINSQQGDGDSTRSGFDLRRARLKFRGHVIEPELLYVVGLSFGRSDGKTSMSDVFIERDLGSGWLVRAGRFRPAFMREGQVSAKQQLLADRSLVWQAFGEDRATGLMLEWADDQASLRLSGVDRDGSALDGESWGASVRGDVALIGALKTLASYSSGRGEAEGLGLGAAVVFFDDNPAGGALDESGISWTVDALWKQSGVNILASLTGQHASPEAADSIDQFAAVVQGGFFVSERGEVVGRVEWGDADDADSNLLIATVGFNRYFHGNDAKFTLDCGYGFEPVGESWASGGAGWRADEPGQDGQIVVRAQLQLAF